MLKRIQWSPATGPIDPVKVVVEPECEQFPCRECRGTGRLPDGDCCPVCKGRGERCQVVAVYIVPKRN